MGSRLGEFEAQVLAGVVWAGGKANGVAVYREIEARTGLSPAVAAIHVTLRRLEVKGLLTSELGTRSALGGSPRRFYEATPEGLLALGTFRELWERLLTDLPLPEPRGGA